MIQVIIDDSRVKGDVEELDDLLLLESNEEGKGTEILTLSKLLNRIPILLAQLKIGNNSYQPKNRISQVVYHKLSKAMLKDVSYY